VIHGADRWRRIEAICEAALEHAPADRAAFLHMACADDDALRHEVDAVLANISRAEAFLEQPVEAIAASVLEPLPAAPLSGHTFNTLVVGPLIGAGGMGQVYRARDTALDRDVAIKVLPTEFARDADRLARFTREARVLASLNHPHIAQIHGLEHVDGATAIVMELVEGETLADRIARGPVVLDDALQLARQIAEALEGAHGQGIVHRDLKPANIQVRSDGTVKVLDFGLAKTLYRSSDQPHDDTNTEPLSTAPGLVLGTAAYMAPEQVKQRPVDRRADLWAFGCVVFEMLTARPAFVGASPADVASKIVEHEPEWTALPANTPPAVRRLLRRCLEKHLNRRLDSAAAARLEIEEAEREPASVASAPTSQQRQHWAWRPLIWASSGAVIALVASMAVTRGPAPPERPPETLVTSVRVALPLGQPGVHFSVAPSGRSVVYVGPYRGAPTLWRRDFDRIDPEPLGTIVSSDPFFSDDGRSIGFEARSELWTMSLDGRAPTRLAPNSALRGGTWGADGQLIVARVGSGLWIVPAAGGEPRQLTVPVQGERHELPQLLPGGRAVLFTILSVKAPARAALYLLDTGETRDLFEGACARFVESGHIVFGRNGKLWGTAFDRDSLETRGEARPVRDDILWSAAGYPQFTINGGVLAFVRTSDASTHIGKSQLFLVNREGQPTALALPPDNYLLARFSPNGERFVVQVGAARDLWSYDLGRGTFTKLTSDRVVAYTAPTWTNDSTRVVFTTWFDGEVGLGSVAADGSGGVELLVRGAGLRSFERTHPVMLPDGSGVVMTGLAPGESVEDLLLVPFSAGSPVKALLKAPGVERNPGIAPSARFIAYNSDESGRLQVYARPFPDLGARRWQISTEGGAFPVWTRGGRELVYRDGQSRTMTVTVRGDSNDMVDFSRPQPLFTYGPPYGSGLDRGFDVTADGERFLFNVSRGGSDDGPEAELVLIKNWVEDLKRLVPPVPHR
jgi:serine/threonine protein kinase